MNIAQLSEQLKDVPQNRLVDYARNPNSVVPQFLALAEIQRRQHLSAQAQPPAQTVAEDVLAQAAPQQMPQQMAPQQMAQQLPENQPGVAQLPTGMPQGMASGGIVAFAGGGMSDDYDDEEEDDIQDQRQNSQMMSLIAGLRTKAKDAVSAAPRAISAAMPAALAGVPASIREAASGIRAALPESYTAAKSKVTPNFASEKSVNSTHPYAPVALDEAKKLGVNPNEILHMLHKETGNLKDPATAVSKAGARGPMQLMPVTAKELGVDINDPEANTRGGVRYYAKMLNMFGGDPVMAMAAYNAGPGRVRQMLKRGEGIESLKPETQNYVKFAQGGIASFAGPRGSDVEEDEDYSNPYLERSRGVVSSVRSLYDALTTPKNYDLYDMYKRNIGDPFARGVSNFVNEPVESQAERFRSYSMTPKVEPRIGYREPLAIEPPKVPPVSAALEMTPAERNRYATIAANNALVKDGVPLPAPSAPSLYNFPPQGGIGPSDYEMGRFPEQAGPQEIDPYKAALLRAAQEREDIKAGAEQDKYLAMLQASLGMMSGTSPYAMANIGQGGMQGVAAYAAAKKQRAAELSDLGKYETRIMNAKEMSEIKRAQLASLEDARQETARINRDRLDLKASDSADISSRKRLELINRAQQDAASDPEYKAIVKIRDQLPEDDPKRKQYEDFLESIKRSYIATAETGKYVPPVRPVFTAPPKEPTFFERITGKGSPTPSGLTPDQQALLDKYKLK
jgi:hypothetical protein